MIMLYRPKSEFARPAEEFAREFERRTAKIIEAVDIDSREGISLAKLYGVMDHPTFVAISNDGQFIQAWTGRPLPLINELAAYASSPAKTL